MKQKRVAAFVAAAAVCLNSGVLTAVAETGQTAGSSVQSGGLIAEAPPCRFGDLNDDGILTGTDLTLLKRQILTNSAYDQTADTDADGDVDADDANVLAAYLGGEIPSLLAFSKYDTDGDGLSDFVETVMQTDVTKADTDGDGLSDFDEAIRTFTDPTVSDFSGTGTSDADADADQDGLTNAEELKRGTNPWLADTDKDGVPDGEEVNTLKTDPLQADSDGDGLTDYEEQELGLDPLNSKTDGTPDGKRVFKQVIPADDPLLADINTEENAYDLSIEMEASGYAKHNLTVQESPYAFVLKDGSAVGAVPQIQYPADAAVEKVTLRFAVKEAFQDNISHYFGSAVGDTYEIDPELDGIKRFNVFKYFEGISTAVPIYTEYNEETAEVTVTLDTFENDQDGNSYGIGSYSLVDMEVWGSMVNDPAGAQPEPAPGRYLTATTADEEPSLVEMVTKTVKALSTTVYQAIVKNYERHDEKQTKTTGFKSGSSSGAPSGAVVSGPFGHRYARFDIAGLNWTQAEQYCKALGGHLAVITTAAEEAAVEALTAAGTLNSYWLGGQMSGSTLKWITGEPVKYTKWSIGQPDHLDTEKYLMIYRADNPVIRDNTQLQWNNIALDGTYPNEPFFGAQNFGFICEWESGAPVLHTDGGIRTVRIGGKVTTLLSPLSALGNTDSDGDGIPDWAEINHKAIIRLGGTSSSASVPWYKVIDYAYGQLKYNDKQKAATNKKTALVAAQVQPVTPAKTDPALSDTDKDGYQDISDPDPLNPPKYLTQYDFLDNEAYFLKVNAVTDDQRLNYDTATGQVTTALAAGTKNQQFRFIWDNKSYKITTEEDNKVLTVVDGGDGTFTVSMTPDRNEDTQRWEVLPYSKEAESRSGFVLRSRYALQTASGVTSLYLNYKDSSKVTVSEKIDSNSALNLITLSGGWSRFGCLYMQLMGWIDGSASPAEMKRAFGNYENNAKVTIPGDYYVSDPLGSGKDVHDPNYSLNMLTCQNKTAFHNMKYADAPMNEVICEVIATYNAICMAYRSNGAADFLRMAVEFEMQGIRTNYLHALLIDRDQLDTAYMGGQFALSLLQNSWENFGSLSYTPYTVPNFDHLTDSFTDAGGWGSDPKLIGYCLTEYNVGYDTVSGTLKSDKSAAKQFTDALYNCSASCGILTESFGPFGFGIHTFAVRAYNSNLYAFNCQCNTNEAKIGANVSDIIGDNGFYYGYALHTPQ